MKIMQPKTVSIMPALLLRLCFVNLETIPGPELDNVTNCGQF